MTGPVLRLLEKLKAFGPTDKRGDEWQCVCPAHRDTRPSLGLGTGEDGRALLTCRSQGCSPEQIVKALGLTMKDLFNEPKSAKSSFEDRIDKLYDYRGENGELLFQAVRLHSPKDFRQRRPDGSGGWEWNLTGVRRVLYRLPELLSAGRQDCSKWVFVVEGEKDADALTQLGLTATTNPMGAGKWKPEYAQALKGRRVAVIPDNDDPGRKHAEQVRASLQGAALRLVWLNLPGLPEKGDVSDWLAAGGTAAKLVELAEEQSRVNPGSNSNGTGIAATVVRPVPTVAPFVPFPLESLPDDVRELATVGAAAIGCDPAFIILPALATLSAAVGATHRIEIKRGWREPPYISTAVIAPSGAKKTPPYKLACEDPAEDLNDRLEDEFAREITEHGIRLAKWEARQSSESESTEPAPEEPVERRFAVSDITLERLICRLQENPRGLLVYRDELDAWLRSFTRYASGGSSDLPSWLSLFSAATVNYSRKTGDRKDIRVRDVGVSVTGTIQPGVMREAMHPALMSAGLFARLAVAMPPVSPRVWTDDEVSEKVTERYSDLVGRLFRLDFAERLPSGRTKPQVLQMTPEARRRFVDFYNRNGDAMGVADGAEAASRSKIEAYAARLALVFSRCHTHVPDDVLDEDMAAGVAIAEWFCNEVPRVYRLLGEGASTSELREFAEAVARLARSPERGGKVTARDLHKANKSRFANPDAATRALDRLVGAGFGKWSESAPGSRGKPTKFFTPEITPLTPEIDPPEAV